MNNSKHRLIGCLVLAITIFSLPKSGWSYCVEGRGCVGPDPVHPTWPHPDAVSANNGSNSGDSQGSQPVVGASGLESSGGDVNAKPRMPVDPVGPIDGQNSTFTPNSPTTSASNSTTNSSSANNQLATSLLGSNASNLSPTELSNFGNFVSTLVGNPPNATVLKGLSDLFANVTNVSQIVDLFANNMQVTMPSGGADPRRGQKPSMETVTVMSTGQLTNFLTQLANSQSSQQTSSLINTFQQNIRPPMPD